MVTNLFLALFLVGSALAQPVTNEQILRRLANDGPAKGNPKATVTLIEFADFQCSFCRKFWQTTLPRIETKYISSGKVRFVYLHFALLGKPSVAAAQASECAHEQGKIGRAHV